MAFEREDRISLSFLAGCVLGGILALNLNVISSSILAFIVYYFYVKLKKIKK